MYYFLRGRHQLLGVVLLAAALVLVAAPIARSQSGPTCFDRTVTIAGTSGNDRKVGTDGTDVIHTFAGEDSVRGDATDRGPGGARDFICLGSGNDGVSAGAGSDMVKGGDGGDRIGGDTVPQAFRDFLYGENGNDLIGGEEGNDVIRGGPGNDVIDPVGNSATTNMGAEDVRAGSGDDTINERGDGVVDTIRCGPGNDTVYAGPNDNVASDCENVNPQQ